MTSAIILTREYLTIPVFNHYFIPAFKNKEIVVENKHGFEENLKDRIIFSLKGKVSEENIYEIMGGVIPTIEEDNKIYSVKWEMNSHNIPEWSMAYPELIDTKPEIIGMYKDSKVASELFCATALGYIAHTSGQKINKTVENSREELRDLGTLLSEI